MRFAGILEGLQKLKEREEREERLGVLEATCAMRKRLPLCTPGGCHHGRLPVGWQET